MRKFLLLSFGLITAFCCKAQWCTGTSDATAIFPTGSESYATQCAICDDGSVWAMMYHPVVSADGGGSVHEYRLQRWDKDGKAQFDDEGLLVSNYKNLTYTMVNNFISADKEGNAILCVTDCRNSQDEYLSFTAYKVSPSGEMLWGEDGKPVSDYTNPSYVIAKMSAVALEDGSVVFTWIDAQEDGNMDVYLQRLDKDGAKTWDEQSVSLIGSYFSYPYLVPSDDNSVIVVFARSASQIIYARKLNAAGEKVWSKDVRIYRGGWGTIPIYTLISVVPSGDGGALISWNDDRSSTNVESAYLSYVTSDGKIGFSHASDEGDVKLGYSGYRQFNVVAAPAADGSGFFTAWRETNAGQSCQGLKMQKVSKSGELMWYEDGVDIEPMDYDNINYLSLQAAGTDKAVLFYEVYYSYYDQQCNACLVNYEGDKLWNDSSLPLSERNHKATDLKSMACSDNESWVYYWNDRESSATTDETFFMGLINIDGTYGSGHSGIESVAVATPQINFDGKAIHAQGKSVQVYTPSGVCVLSQKLDSEAIQLDVLPGIYIVVVDGVATQKVVVK